MSAPDGVESIIRRIAREEIERAAAASPSGSAVGERQLLSSVVDVAAASPAIVVANILGGQARDDPQASARDYISRQP